MADACSVSEKPAQFVPGGPRRGGPALQAGVQLPAERVDLGMV